VGLNFEDLIGKRVSILITGKNGKKETYTGTVESAEGSFIRIKTLPSSTFEIDYFIIRTDLVKCIWIYKEGTP
jgi:hypothetical protein